MQSKHEFWEDPDDGSDSENEYEGEEEDGIGNDLDNESDWEDDSRVQKLTTTDNYEEELAKGSSLKSLTLLFLSELCVKDHSFSMKNWNSFKVSTFVCECVSLLYMGLSICRG